MYAFRHGYTCEWMSLIFVNVHGNPLEESLEVRTLNQPITLINTPSRLDLLASRMHVRGDECNARPSQSDLYVCCHSVEKTLYTFSCHDSYRLL